jgi:hypothetical protein
MPISSDIYAEAKRRGIKVDALPTREACSLLADIKKRDVFAVLHVTC